MRRCRHRLEFFPSPRSASARGCQPSPSTVASAPTGICSRRPACGVAAFDYDSDGWLDVFVVNGTTLEGFPKGKEPTSHLYRNRRDGTFEDVTPRPACAQTGWGQAACAGDYDNDGHDDLFVTYWGRIASSATRRRHVRGRHDRRRVSTTSARAGARAARSSTTTATASSISSRRTTSTSISRRRRCRNRACAGTRVSRSRAVRPGCRAARTSSTATSATARSRTCPSAAGITERQRHLRARRQHARLRRRRLGRPLRGERLESERALPQQPRRHVHRRRRSPPGAPTARTASRRPAWASRSATTTATARMDIFKTNFAGDTSTLYANNGNGFCDDRTFAGGIGINTRWLGWGVGFLDLDLRRLAGPLPRQRPRLPRGGAAQDRGRLSAAQGRLPQSRRRAVRRRHGAARAAGDGRRGPGVARRSATSTTTATSTSSSTTSTTRRTCTGSTSANRGTGGAAAGRHARRTAARSARACAARRRRSTQVEEVRGGGSYYSQNDLRVHFGLGAARRSTGSRCAGRTGLEEEWTGLAANRIVTLSEGSGSRRASQDAGRPLIAARRSCAHGDAQAARRRRRAPRARRGAPPDRRRRAADAIERSQCHRRRHRAAARGLLLGVAHYHADDACRAIELLEPLVDRLAEQARSSGARRPGARPCRDTRRASAEAVPHLEATPALGAGQLELAYVLARPTCRRRQPDTRTAALARDLRRDRGLGRGPPASPRS